MQEKEFQRVSRYVRQNTGVDLSKKKLLIQVRLEQYLSKNGYPSYDAFMDDVEHDPRGAQANSLISLLTTHHTYFMRESTHFDFLRERALPEWKMRVSASKDLRIWSAASSTGEEPYTLAMVIKDFFGLEHSQWNTQILATDVAASVIAFAQQGIYQKEQLKVLPEHWRRRYFKPIGGEDYEVTSELKKEVIFRQFNLMHPFPFRKKFHIIFLRNVMIYFEGDTKAELIRKMTDYLEPGGYLIIGTTESLDRKQTELQYVMPSVYQKSFK